MATDAKVDTQCLAYQRMETHWPLIEALMGDTQTMRDKGETHLPRFESESIVDWRARRDGSFLYPALKDTHEKFVGEPFSKPTTFEGKDGLSEALTEMEQNADSMGSNITQFAKEVFSDGLQYGLTHIFVEHPKNPNRDPRSKTKMNPYLVHIKAKDLIGWRSKKDEKGMLRLVQIRFKETTVEADGDYGEQEVEYIRVYNIGTKDAKGNVSGGFYRKFKKDKESGEYRKEGEDEIFTRSEMPLVTIYFNRTGYMTAEPPLKKLAWKNLEHWQSSSDQRNVLHAARVPFPFVSGVTQDEKEEKTTIGSHNVVKSTNPEARAAWCELKGKSIEAGEKDIKRIEEQMEVLGLQFVIRATTGPTATERKSADQKNLSAIQTWIQTTEGGLRKAIEYAAAWLGETLPDEFKVNIFSDIGILARSDSDLKLILEARAAGQLDHETFISEWKRRGVLSETVESKAILKALEDEGPSLGEEYDEDREAA